MNKFVGNMLDTANQYMCYMKLGTSNSFCVPIYIYIYMSVIYLFFFGQSISHLLYEWSSMEI